MRARVESARSKVGQHVRLSLAVMGLALAVFVLFVPGSLANLTGSSFEGGDGNMAVDTPGNTDWANVHGGALTLTDQPSGPGDNTFTQGTKENDTTLSIDTTHSAPPKDDILRAYVGSETVSGSTFLYLSWIRAVTNGDAHVDFELNQQQTSGWTATSTSVTLNRTVGDLLISYDFSGSGTPTITSFTWDGSAWTNQTDLSSLGFAEAAVSTADFTDPISGGTVAAGTFGEASINLSDIPGSKFTPNSCEAFGSVLAKTRSSGSGGTSEIKDFILPGPIHVSNCGTVKIVKDAQPNSSQSFGFHTTNNLIASPGTFSLVDDGTASNTKEIDNVNPGTYQVSEDANPAGWQLTGVTCDDTDSLGSVPNRSASVVVGANETVTCTFTNQKQPTLTVNKVCNPANDTGKFNLRVDGSTVKTDAACGTGTGAQPSTVGSHTVSEQAGTGTDLSNYVSVIGGDCAANGAITLQAGQDAVCTITNSRKATLTVNKVCAPSNDSGKFNLQVDGSTAKADATCGTGTGAQVVSAASHTVSEAAGSGTDLSNYTSVIGGDCAANGSITLAAGDNKTCTITNTRKPTLTVNKVCVPANDSGKFNLQIDGQTTKADATCGTGTGAVVTSVGAHTVAEAAGTGNDLTLYTSLIGGDCAANGSITLAAGQNAVCTITNTRKPSVTVNKVCNPTTDTGKFNLQIDGSTAKADAACGTGTGPVVSSVGSHTVAETAGTGTSLSNYTSVIGGDCAANGSVSLAAGQSAVCTITNTRKPTLTVNKVCNPTTDTGKFNLQVDGATAGTGANAACAGTTGAVVSSIGAHSVGETYGTGTNSSDYFPGVFGGDCSTDGKITLAAGQNAVCTITNNRKGAIAITKTPATQAVDSGGTATFTITVTNTGPVTLTNVVVTDPLSLNCAKTIGTLTPGQVSTYSCTQPNVTAAFTNVATVTGHPPFGPDLTASASANVTINPPPPPPPSTPTPAPAPTVVDLAIVKTAGPTSMTKGANVTYTLTVTNNGPVTDTAVQVADSLPFGVTYVSATSSQGTCSGTSVVQCNVGTMTNGQKVTITIVGTTTTTGTILNTATVVGALPETTLTNNTSSASITVAAPPAPKPAPKPFKPPVVKPKPKPVPPPCYAVVVAPKTLTVGKNGHLQLQVTAKNKGISGVKVEVKGAGILKLSGRTDSAGKVTLVLHPKKAGIVLVKPASYKGCANPRIGVIGAFTPPVTG